MKHLSLFFKDSFLPSISNFYPVCISGWIFKRQVCLCYSSFKINQCFPSFRTRILISTGHIKMFFKKHLELHRFPPTCSKFLRYCFRYQTLSPSLKNHLKIIGYVCGSCISTIVAFTMIFSLLWFPFMVPFNTCSVGLVFSSEVDTTPVILDLSNQSWVTWSHRIIKI